MTALPKFRVKVAFHNFRVGEVIQPTGLWRDRLVQLGFIEREREVAALIQPPATRAAKAKHRD